MEVELTDLEFEIIKRALKNFLLTHKLTKEEYAALVSAEEKITALYLGVEKVD